MLPKNKRLNTKNFKSLLDSKRVVSTPIFLFFYTKTTDPHYSFVAPKKIFKTAVKRNKYRRLGYNCLRTINISNGSGVFFYKNLASSSTKEEIQNDIFSILKRVGFLKNEKTSN